MTYNWRKIVKQILILAECSAGDGVSSSSSGKSTFSASSSPLICWLGDGDEDENDASDLDWHLACISIVHQFYKTCLMVNIDLGLWLVYQC